MSYASHVQPLPPISLQIIQHQSLPHGTPNLLLELTSRPSLLSSTLVVKPTVAVGTMSQIPSLALFNAILRVISPFPPLLTVKGEHTCTEPRIESTVQKTKHSTKMAFIFKCSFWLEFTKQYEFQFTSTPLLYIDDPLT